MRDHVLQGVALVVHGDNHVAVAGEVGAQERRLSAVARKAVRKQHERERTARRRRIAHRVLTHLMRAEQTVAILRALVLILPSVALVRGIPELERESPTAALGGTSRVAQLVALDANRVRTA